MLSRPFGAKSRRGPSSANTPFPNERGRREMPTYRYPVLMVEDAAGGFTALPVECAEGLAGFGSTPREALQQCRDYLVWQFRQTGGLLPADFKDVQLSIFKTTVRPEYRVGDRIDPCPEGVLLRVPCIHGRQQSGAFVAALPLIGVRFTFYEPEALRGLVSRYTQQKLEGLTPRE